MAQPYLRLESGVELRVLKQRGCKGGFVLVKVRGEPGGVRWMRVRRDKLSQLKFFKRKGDQ
jgi:hypothetical protein